MKRYRWPAFVLTLLFVGSVHAVADDAALAAREAHLAASLRCVVCQNQSLADSAAPLAADMRRQVREQLAQGRSDEEVRAWFTQRYGDAVSYEPPFRPGTWLLWLGPFVLLAGAGLALRHLIGRRATAATALTPAERDEALALLREDQP